MEWIAEPGAWVALVTLTVLEIVLGIDNIVFITVLVAKLPAHQQDRARRLGLLLAMGMRIVLLLSIAWLTGLTAALFTVFGEAISGRDLILIAGGLFLLGKATVEIHHKVEGGGTGEKARAAVASFGSVIAQILVIDAVFSLDSVITAVGIAEHVPVMVIAIVVSVVVMMIFAGPVGRFVNRHPTIQVLALAFLILIGVALVADGLDLHVPRGYIYFAMGFSVLVELLQLRQASRSRESAGTDPSGETT